MRYFRDLSLLGLYCLLVLFYGNADIKMVAAVLCTVILVCGCYSCTQKYRQMGMLLAYGLTGFWNQDFICFYPVFIYCSVSCRKKIPGILLTAAGVVFYLEKIPAKTLVSLLLGCVIAAFMECNTRKYTTLKEEFRRTKDDSEERNLLLAEKNKMLLEKQDYEIETAILKERNRIAREIHDNVGHVLSRSILLVGAAKAVNKDESMSFVLNGLDESLNSAMNSIRTSVHDLHDDSVNLKEVLMQLAGEFTFCQATLVYDVSDQIPKEVKYCFISIVKEALANISRHSNATEVKITVREHPALFQLSVEDNGKEIKYNKQDREGIGLTNMKERVNGLKGNFRITTEDGFRIFITVPKDCKQQK